MAASTSFTFARAVAKSLASTAFIASLRPLPTATRTFGPSSSFLAGAALAAASAGWTGAIAVKANAEAVENSAANVARRMNFVMGFLLVWPHWLWPVALPNREHLLLRPHTQGGHRITASRLGDRDCRNLWQPNGGFYPRRRAGAAASGSERRAKIAQSRATLASLLALGTELNAATASCLLPWVRSTCPSATFAPSGSAGLPAMALRMASSASLSLPELQYISPSFTAVVASVAAFFCKSPCAAASAATALLTVCTSRSARSPLSNFAAVALSSTALASNG